jgi:hypothetical protein
LIYLPVAWIQKPEIIKAFVVERLIGTTTEQFQQDKKVACGSHIISIIVLKEE